MSYPLLHTLFCFLLLLPFSTVAQTNGTVAVGASITAGDNSTTPWLSASQDFAFGFKPLQDNNLFLLSIWYYKIPDQTIVWYANEGVPVSAGSQVGITVGKGLVLSDPQGGELWSSFPILDQVANGFMRDTGSFELVGVGGGSDNIWESFKYPTDTLLPTQIMESGGVLFSRQSEKNFSLGRFQLRLLEDGNLVLNTRDVGTNFAYDAYYWSDTYDGVNDTNRGYRVIFNETGYILVLTRSNQTVEIGPTTELPSGDYYYRATLNFDGVLTLYYHPKTENGNPKTWTPLWSEPDNICVDTRVSKGRGVCGFNSICTIGDYKRPNCSCPKGFSLLDPNDKYGDCKPSFALSCEGDYNRDLYDLTVLIDTDWPLSDYEQLQPISEHMCRNSCLKDCFCGVAILRGDSCWKKKLPLSNGRKDSAINGKAFVKFSKGDLMRKEDEKNPENKRHFLLNLLPTAATVTLVLVYATWYLRKRAHINKRRMGEGEELQSLFKTTTAFAGNANVPNLLVFRFTDLVEATNNFSFENKLGEGGYGPVYKGVLHNGQVIAIKRLSRTSTQGFEEFKNEVMLTAKLQHVNLVRVLGFCTEKEEQMLIYEYMPNKSLDHYLYDPTMGLLLDWEKRVQIIEGVTQGLLYLQEYSRLTIIHRDLKASNILLDNEMKPKITDFGMARIFQKDEFEANTSRIVGTYGYVPPEYVKRGIYSTKSDVYSFGVLLLQIISGKRNHCLHGLHEDLKLLDYAYDLWKCGKGMEFMDPSLDDTNSSCKLVRCMQIALLCVQENPADRPSMLKLLVMLTSETAAMNIPKRPAFSTRSDEDEVQVQESTSQQEIWSVGDVSITQMVAR